MTYQESPIDFIKTQGWKYKVKGGEIITSCPFCEKPEHLYINAENGTWLCQRCGESGNLYQLKKRLGLIPDRNISSIGQAIKAPQKTIPTDRVEKMHNALLGDQEALGYCQRERGWGLDVLKRLKIGLRTDTRGKWLAYPYFQNGSCAGIKYRILPEYQQNYSQRFEREPGCKSILYNADALQRHDEIILLSGESDLLSALTLGFENAVATSVGETGLPPAAVEALSRKRKVWALFDNDETGPKGARNAARRVGYERTWNAVLPAGVKDVNDLLRQGANGTDLQAILDAAQRFDVPTITDIYDALGRLEQEKKAGSFNRPEEVTAWSALNRKLGTWRPGNLIVISGPQGTGKTSFTLNIQSHWAQKGFPALLYCLEMSIEELAQHVLCAYYRCTEEQITPAIIETARKELVGWPLYLGANPRITDTKTIAEMLRQAVRRYGLRLVAFDNLHMLARSVDHRSEEVGIITKSFKLLAMETEIPIILIAQPRKLTPGRIMTPWDLKDSVDIFSDADQILLLHRELVGARNDKNAVADAAEGAEIYSSKTLIRLAKARHMAGRDVVLYFEGAQHRFREIYPDELKKN
jgi:hypothetical protein